MKRIQVGLNHIVTGSGFAVTSPALHRIAQCRDSFDPRTSGDRQISYESGRATPDGVMVLATFAMVLVSTTWVGAAVTLRIASIVNVLDVLGDSLSPCGQTSRCIWSEKK